MRLLVLCASGLALAGCDHDWDALRAPVTPANVCQALCGRYRECVDPSDPAGDCETVCEGTVASCNESELEDLLNDCFEGLEECDAGSGAAWEECTSSADCASFSYPFP